MFSQQKKESLFIKFHYKHIFMNNKSFKLTFEVKFYYEEKIIII